MRRNVAENGRSKRGLDPSCIFWPCLLAPLYMQLLPNPNAYVVVTYKSNVQNNSLYTC